MFEIGDVVVIQPSKNCVYMPGSALGSLIGNIAKIKSKTYRPRISYNDKYEYTLKFITFESKNENVTQDDAEFIKWRDCHLAHFYDNKIDISEKDIDDMLNI